MNLFLNISKNLFLKAMLLLITAVIFSLYGNVFYIDPENGLDSNNGSYENPWRSFSTILNYDYINSKRASTSPYDASKGFTDRGKNGPVRGGDTIYLMNGSYGKISITKGYYNYDYITVLAFPGHRPIVNTLQISASSKWRFSGLDIIPPNDSTTKTAMVSIEHNGWWGPSTNEIIIDNCRIYSNTEDPNTWSKEDWSLKAWTAIYTQGAKHLNISNNEIFNVSYGIRINGDSCIVKKNTITNFSDDGMHGIGDYLTFESNIVKNCYKVNSNHNDGFQSWSVGSDGKVGTGIRRGLKIIGNTIIARSFDSPFFESELQGVGLFDGFYEDIEVVNNLVIVNHYHGISVYGIKNSKIINNTVMSTDTVSLIPKILITDHKNGIKSQNCIITNNLAPNIDLSKLEKGVISKNVIVGINEASFFFKDWKKHDFHLKPNNIAVKYGNSMYAPFYDIEGIPRPRDAISIGAFQCVNTTNKVTTPDSIHIKFD